MTEKEIQTKSPSIIQEARQEVKIKKTQEIVEFEELYKKLSIPIEKKFLIEYKEDNKVFTGYHAQYAIDLLNDIVGLGKWETKFQINKEELINKGWVVAGTLTIKIVVEDQFFIVNGCGGCYAKDIGNAYKGFKTSAFKNACRYLGIGKELYIQGIEDDIKEEKENNFGHQNPQDTTIDENEVSNELIKKIESSQSTEDLNQWKDAVEAIEGKAVKDVLLKKYNNKRISLIESK